VKDEDVMKVAVMKDVEGDVEEEFVLRILDKW